jgi:hypothetical protein
MEMLTSNGKTHDDTNGHNHVTVAQPLDHAKILADAKALVQALEAQLAWGTRDNLKTPPAEEPKADIAAKINAELHAHVRTTEELAKAIGESVEKTKGWIKANRARVADIGTPAQAKWVWRMGDQTSTKDLQAMVQRIITETPMTTAELVAVTGARMGRVNGVLVEIQRAVDAEGKPLVPIFNTGTKFRARWYILPAHAERANLPPKRAKK